MIARRLRAGSGAALAVALAAAGLAPFATGAAAETDPAAGQDTRVIVLMAGPDGEPVAPAELAAASAQTERAAVAAQRTMLSAAADQGIDAEVEHEFTDLVHAVALTVPADDVDALRALPGVADVVPDQRVRASTDVSVPLVGAPEVWEQEAPAGGPADGTGTVVAVLDSGVDYTHPSLGGGFGPDHKVVAGYDFYNGDDDPMDDNGHGTHVAGIIAGTGDPAAPVTGVAPGAQLTAYKVMNARGEGWESDIIAGLEAATDPDNPYRADVVNMSLGGPGDGTDPIGLAATAATEAGVVVVASSGNSGPGAHTMGSPALADGVLSVGASASALVLPTARLAAPRQEPIATFRVPFSAPAPDAPVVGELVDVGDGNEEDYDRVGDVTGKVVAYRQNLPALITDVAPWMIEQARLAEERGAVALLAYIDNYGGPVLMGENPGAPSALDSAAAEPGVVDVPLPSNAISGDDFRMDQLVVMGLLESQWEVLKRDLGAGPVQVEISGEDVTDQVLGFSSRGPSPDYSIEPDLVAPGFEIMSAIPTEWWAPGQYRLSGTSMAAPHVAGAAALVRQLRPDDAATDVNARLTGSAAPVEAGPTISGAGRLDVAAAAAADVIASPASVSLGLADLSTPVIGGSGTTTLRNTSDADVTVALTAQQAPGSAGTATVTPAEATIPAGGELEVEVAVSADRPEQDADLSGWIVATTGDEQVRVPYLLAARSLVVQTSPDPSDGASEAFIWTPGPLDEPPTVTVTPPRGRPVTVQAEHDHGSWYRAALTGPKTGAYAVDVTATTQDGIGLVGSATFEVVAPVGNSNSPASWQPIGPNSGSGPIATTPADPDVAAITQYLKAGPWTTDDGGESWRQHNRLPVAGGTGNGNLVVAADDPDVMWYAVNGSTGGFLDTTADPAYRGRILRTEDGGETWRQLDVPDVSTIALVSDPQTQVLVAVTADALLVSRDRGDTWVSHPNLAGSELTGAAVSGDDLFLADLRGVWAVRGLIAGDPTGTEQIYAPKEGFVEGIAADDDLLALLVDDVVIGSHDGGRGWDVNYPIPDGGALDIVLSGDLLMVTTYRPVQHVSRDGGQTWAELPQPVVGAIEDDVVAWDDGLLWSSPGAGLFAVDENGEDPQRIGVQAATPYDLEIVDRGTPTLLAGTDFDVYATGLPTRPKLPGGGTEWGLSGYEAYVGTRVAQLAADPQDPETVWKIRKDALSQFWVYRSTDGGQEWEHLASTNEVPFDLAVSPADSGRVVIPFWSLGGVGVYVTDDDGKSWRKQFHSEMFTTVAMDPADPDGLWLGSASGLYRSDDFGRTVRKVADGQVTSVAVDGERVVAGGAAIQVSDDGGQTFRTADTGGVPMSVGDLIVSPADPDTWYAATTSFSANGLVKGGRGVLRSTDGGQTWVNVSSGLQNLNVVSLEISPDGRWLYAGTQLGGVHRIRTR